MKNCKELVIAVATRLRMLIVICPNDALNSRSVFARGQGNLQAGRRAAWPRERQARFLLTQFVGYSVSLWLIYCSKPLSSAMRWIIHMEADGFLHVILGYWWFRNDHCDSTLDTVAWRCVKLFDSLYE